MLTVAYAHTFLSYYSVVFFFTKLALLTCAFTILCQYEFYCFFWLATLESLTHLYFNLKTFSCCNYLLS